MSVSAGAEGIDQKYSTVFGQQLEIEVHLHRILKLATTIRKTETVPQSSRTNPSLSPSRSLSTSAASTRRTRDSRTYVVEQPDPRPEDQTPVETYRACPRCHRKHIPVRGARNPPEARVINPNDQARSEARPSRAIVAPRSPSICSEDDLIGIPSSGDDLRIVVSPEQREIQGKITNRAKDEYLVTAKIEPRQRFNFMTGWIATELGLLSSVQPLKGADKETWIMLPSGTRIRPDGTIQLQWCPPEAPDTRPINLQFFVLSKWWERKIILGAPYVEKERQYAGRRENRENQTQQQG